MPISFHPSAEYVDRTVTSFFLADSTCACAQGDLTVGLEHDAVAPARDAQRNEHVVENRVVADRLEELPEDQFLVAPVESDAVADRSPAVVLWRPSEPMTISTQSRG